MGRFAALDPVRDEETGRITIRVPKLKLSLMLQNAVRKVELLCGEKPTLEESIWLYELCKEDILPKADDPAAFLVAPVTLGIGTKYETSFYDPTVMALSWLEDYASRWWEAGEDLPPALYAYAHSGGGETKADTFQALTERSSAVRAVNKWCRRLPFSERELLWVYNKINRVPDHGYTTLELKPNSYSRDHNTDPMEWGEIVAGLSAIYGLPPEHFMRMNETMVVQMWNASDRTPIAAMMGGGQRMAKKAKGGKSFLVFNAAIREIARRHMKQGEDLPEGSEDTDG